MVALDGVRMGYSELASCTGMDQRQLGRTLEKLRNSGLVERKVWSIDPPLRTLYQLSDRGKRIIKCIGCLDGAWEGSAETSAEGRGPGAPCFQVSA